MYGELADSYPNRVAFLSMLATSEGTKGRCNDDGYSSLVGTSCFHSYNDHPRVSIFLPNLNIHSTAAGRYQILAKIYDFYKRELSLVDFSPAAQDSIAIQLIRECNALSDIDAGNIESAIMKCGSRWASLPANSYGQHQQSINFLIGAYTGNNGLLAI